MAETTTKAPEQPAQKDEKATVVVVQTEVKVFMDGEEVASVTGDSVTGIYVQGSGGAVSYANTGGALPVGVYVLTAKNPSPVRPLTEDEQKAAKQAEKDAEEAAKRGATIGGPARNQAELDELDRKPEKK